MKFAIIGSRGITNADIGAVLPAGTTEIVSGSAKGVDTLAREYANTHGIKLTEFLPEYEKYGRSAPLLWNEEICRYADEVHAWWDGKSRGTKFVIDFCTKIGKKCTVHYAR